MMISDPPSTQDGSGSHQNGSTLTNDLMGMPGLLHDTKGLNVIRIPENMATVGANDVAERPPPENHLELLRTTPTITFLQRCSNDSKQRTVKVIHPLCSGLLLDNQILRFDTTLR